VVAPDSIAFQVWQARPNLRGQQSDGRPQTPPRSKVGLGSLPAASLIVPRSPVIRGHGRPYN